MFCPNQVVGGSQDLGIYLESHSRHQYTGGKEGTHSGKWAATKVQLVCICSQERERASANNTHSLTCCDDAIQAAVFIPAHEQQFREGIQNWSIAYARTLEAHLQVCSPW